MTNSDISISCNDSPAEQYIERIYHKIPDYEYLYRLTEDGLQVQSTHKSYPKYRDK